jgi:cytochrome P450
MMHIANRVGKYPKSFVRARDRVDEAIFAAVEQTRNDPRLDERDDVLAMLVQARHDDGSPMSDRELRDQLITLLLQGHQSTATALAWALERLMRHPDAFERLRAEAQTGGDEYLDAVVNETLRVRPPVGLVMRMVRRPFQLGEYEIEPGTLIAPCIYLIHRNERLWDEPERFRPERFLEQKPDRYAWIPFGSGERHCIGRSFATTEIKVVLRTIALRTRLAPAEETDEEIVRAGIMFSPSRGARAVLKERMPAAHAATATG